MNIQQFRHFISNMKVAGGGFGAEKADESFATVAPLCRVKRFSNKTENNTCTDLPGEALWWLLASYCMFHLIACMSISWGAMDQSVQGADL